MRKLQEEQHKMKTIIPTNKTEKQKPAKKSSIEKHPVKPPNKSRGNSAYDLARQKLLAAEKARATLSKSPAPPKRRGLFRHAPKEKSKSRSGDLLSSPIPPSLKAFEEKKALRLGSPGESSSRFGSPYASSIVSRDNSRPASTSSSKTGQLPPPPPPNPKPKKKA